MDYFIWLHADDKTLSRIVRIPENELKGNNYLLGKGKSLRSWFPAVVTYPIDKYHKNIYPDAPPEPNGTILADSIPNLLFIKLVSAKLASILTKGVKSAIELFPIQLVDENNELITDSYSLLNPTKVVSCLDKAKSSCRMSRMVPDEINRFYNLVLDRELIPKEAKLFCLEGKLDVLIVREDLVKTIMDEGCTGIRFEPVENFQNNNKLLLRPELIG